MMIRFSSGILLLLTVIEALLLLPTTATYAGGIIIALTGAFGGNDGVNLAFLLIAGILVIPGYALFSLWWLVIKFRKLSFSQVPFHIYAGLIIGAIIAIILAAPYTPTPSMQPTTGFKALASFLASGVGPLFVLFTVLLIMWLKKVA